MDITIYHTQTESLINQQAFHQLLQQLPATLHPKALRYRSELNAYNYVAGRLLLKRGLDFFELDNDLEKVEFQKNGKPILSGIDFNISHSDHQVVCAFSKEGRLGIDLEKVKPIEFDNFTAMFSAKEWVAINSADDSLRAFYWFWTRKESIIKALGLNLGHLHQIELDVSLDHFIAGGKQWFLQDIILDDGFLGAVCCEKKIGEVKLVEVCF